IGPEGARAPKCRLLTHIRAEVARMISRVVAGWLAFALAAGPIADQPSESQWNGLSKAIDTPVLVRVRGRRTHLTGRLVEVTAILIRMESHGRILDVPVETVCDVVTHAATEGARMA